MAPPRRPRAARAPTERATLHFHGVGAAGDGIATYNDRSVYAAHTAPGDVAIADIRGDRAEIVELLEFSNQRRKPECPHTLRCGGCALQHLATGPYTSWKRDRLAMALARVGLGTTPVGALVCIAPATRRRATFAARRTGKEIALGFNARRSSQISAIDDCKILHPDILRRLPALRALATLIDAPRFDLGTTLCDNGLDVDIVGDIPDLFGAPLAKLMKSSPDIIRISSNGAPALMRAAPIVDFDGLAVTPPPGAFLQASKEGEAALIALVKAGVGGARRVADLFSGCGTFALPLAKTAQVDAFDADKPAIAALGAAVSAAHAAGVPLRARAQTRDLFERPLMAADLSKYGAVVFDPPRAGASAQAAEIARSKVQLAIGVSCDPETFSRDAAILSQGGFTLIEVTPIDQFVYAPHIELVGVFRRA